MLKGLVTALIFLGISVIMKAGQGRKKKPEEKTEKNTWYCPNCQHQNPNEKSVREHCGRSRL